MNCNNKKKSTATIRNIHSKHQEKIVATLKKVVPTSQALLLQHRGNQQQQRRKAITIAQALLLQHQKMPLTITKKNTIATLQIISCNTNYSNNDEI